MRKRTAVDPDKIHGFHMPPPIFANFLKETGKRGYCRELRLFFTAEYTGGSDGLPCQASLDKEENFAVKSGPRQKSVGCNPA
jgi:hypothetical protein